MSVANGVAPRPGQQLTVVEARRIKDLVNVRLAALSEVLVNEHPDKKKATLAEIAFEVRRWSERHLP